MNFINEVTSTSTSVNERKKYKQKKHVLQLLYNNETLSVPELSKLIGISMPTTLGMLNDLAKEGLVTACGTGESKGGRKPSLYSLSKDSLYIIACDMGRYNATVTVFNCHNEQVTPKAIVETSIDDPEFVEKLYETSAELIRGEGIPMEKIVGIGVGMPGLVDASSGINYTIKDARYQNVKVRIEEKFEKQAYVDNDARMQAYGEYTFGNAKGRKNAIVINWNWGLGLGMILNGKLYRGTTGLAGEFSHIQIVEDGELCICGKKGCLETIASANTLLKLAKNGIDNHVVSQLTERFYGRINEIRPEHIISAAKSGDEFSISILNTIGMALGKGISMLIQLLNPEVIVIGGPIAKANQFVLTPIQQSLNRFCLEKMNSNTDLAISEISDQSGLLGITAILYQKLFSEMVT